MHTVARRLARGRDLLTLAGLAAGVVPFAVLVHIVAELAAAAPASGVAFAFRHAYMLPLVAGSLLAFGAALGIGRGRAELVRRSAMTRAAIRRTGTPAGVCHLVLANLAFFAATQTLEGTPIAAGSVLAGLVVAVAASLLAAFVVYALGRTLIVAIAIALGERPVRTAPIVRPRRDPRVSRVASAAFGLFVPNRPPPVPSSI